MKTFSKKYLVLAIYAVIILVSTANAQDNLKKGITAVKSGDYVTGINLLKDVVSKDKGYDANFYYGEALLRTGSIEDARKYLEIAIKDDEEGVDALKSLGEYYTMKKEYDKANTYFKKALKVDPNNIPALIAQSANFQAQGKIDDANNVLYLAQSISKQQFEKEDPKIYVALGDNWYSRDSYKAALDNYDKALKLNSNIAKAYYGKGRAYFKLKNVSDAYTAFDDAIKKDANFAEAYLEKGKLLYFNGNYKAAAEAFKKFSQLKPGSQEGNSYFAKTLYAEGKYDEALSLLQEVLKIDPASYTGNLYTAYIYSEKEAPDSLTQVDYYNKAVEYFKKVPMKDFEAEDLIKYGKVLVNVRDFESSYGIFKSAISKDSLDSKAYYEAGKAHFKGEDYDNTLALLNKASALGMKDRGLSLFQGFTCFYLKKYDESAVYFQDAISIDDKFTLSYLWLAKCYRVLNKNEEAIKVYEQVIIIEPDNQEAKDILKLLKKQ